MTKAAVGDESIPRYMAIVVELRARISGGRYPLDSSLPSENELCEEFDVSRYTVREALRRLVEIGVIRRRQGSGSVVVAREPSASYVHSLASLTDLFQYALDTHYEVVSIEQVAVSARVAERIGAQPGEVWNLVKGVRRTHAEGDVVSYTHSYVPKRLTRFTPELPACVGAFYAHLSRRAREEIVEADQEIFGEPMSAETARRLGAKRGDMSICALRRYRSVRGALIVSLNWHVAETFRFQMKLLRSKSS